MDAKHKLLEMIDIKMLDAKDVVKEIFVNLMDVDTANSYAADLLDEYDIGYDEDDESDS